MIDLQEEFEERSAIIQFCSGIDMTREDAERIAAKQLKMDTESVFRGKNWW